MTDGFLDDGSKCVVLCAGKGTRLNSPSKEIPKVMLPAGEKPILAHVVERWSQYTDDFIFVVGFEKEQVIEFAQKLPVNSTFVEQKELNGIAEAITLTEDHITDRFLVVLGDCVIDGKFEVPSDLEQGIGVVRTKDEQKIKQNYSVELEDGSISKVVEKPTNLVNDLCGMGVYLFQKKLFDYIPMTPPSEVSNNVEITDVIQTMVDHDEDIKPLFFEGTYINVNTPEDLKMARKKSCPDGG